MLTAFKEKVAEQAAIGWRPQALVLLHELRDWPTSCLQADWQGRHFMKLPINRLLKWLIILLALAGVGWIVAFAWFMAWSTLPKRGPSPWQIWMEMVI